MFGGKNKGDSDDQANDNDKPEDQEEEEVGEDGKIIEPEPPQRPDSPFTKMLTEMSTRLT